MGQMSQLLNRMAEALSDEEAIRRTAADVLGAATAEAADLGLSEDARRADRAALLARLEEAIGDM